MCGQPRAALLLSLQSDDASRPQGRSKDIGDTRTCRTLSHAMQPAPRVWSHDCGRPAVCRQTPRACASHRRHTACSSVRSLSGEPHSSYRACVRCVASSGMLCPHHGALAPTCGCFTSGEALLTILEGTAVSGAPMQVTHPHGNTRAVRLGCRTPKRFTETAG